MGDAVVERSDAVVLGTAGVRRWGIEGGPGGTREVCYLVALVLCVTTAFASRYVGPGATRGLSGAAAAVLVSLVVAWVAVALAAGRILRTVSTVTLCRDGTLLLAAPVRAVRTRADRLRELRPGGRTPVLHADDVSVRLDRTLVTPGLVGSLRRHAPLAVLPDLDRPGVVGGRPGPASRRSGPGRVAPRPARTSPPTAGHWTVGPGYRVEAALTTVFFAVGGGIGTRQSLWGEGAASWPVASFFFTVWWGIAVAIGLSWLRTATAVRLDERGGIVVAAPVRTVHTQLDHLWALRANGTTADERRRNRGYRLQTGDGDVRLPQRLVDRALVDALRASTGHVADGAGT